MRISPSLCVCVSKLLQGLTFAYVWVCVCGCVSVCMGHGCYRAVSGLPSDLSLCSVLQCVAVCCSALQCVVCRSVLSQVPLSLSLSLYMGSMLLQVLQGLACVVVCYSA